MAEVVSPPSTAADRSSERDAFAKFALTHDPELRTTLIQDHLGLAVQLARRFAGRNEPLEDLVQVASVGLILSVDRYDPERGVEFASFAVRTILGELKRYFRDKCWAVRAPRKVQELYLEVRETSMSLTQELARPPTVMELAAATRASEEEVLEALEATYSYRLSSIDHADQTEEPPVSRLRTEDKSLLDVEEHWSLAPAMAQLTPRERLILRLRFVDDLTQSEIAKRIGVSQMQVSRILGEVLTRVRDALARTEECSGVPGERQYV